MTALFSTFKLLLKIAAVPVVAILALLVWFCTWLVYVSGAVLGLVSLILGLRTCRLSPGAILSAGISSVLLVFLQSPFGLPTAA